MSNYSEIGAKMELATFVELPDGNFLRCDSTENQKILYAHNEDSGNDYVLTPEDLIGAKFYKIVKF